MHLQPVVVAAVVVVIERTRVSYQQGRYEFSGPAVRVSVVRATLGQTQIRLTTARPDASNTPVVH